MLTLESHEYRGAQKEVLKSWSPPNPPSSSSVNKALQPLSLNKNVDSLT